MQTQTERMKLRHRRESAGISSHTGLNSTYPGSRKHSPFINRNTEERRELFARLFAFIVALPALLKTQARLQYMRAKHPREYALLKQGARVTSFKARRINFRKA